MKTFLKFLFRLIVGGLLIASCVAILALGDSVGLPIFKTPFIIAIVGFAGYIAGWQKFASWVLVGAAITFILWFLLALVVALYPQFFNNAWNVTLTWSTKILFYLTP